MERDYVGMIRAELLVTINDAPAMSPKGPYIEAKLQELFGDYDWSKSFQSTQVLLYDEVLPCEILIGIHQWLRRKCADIENICLVTTHHPGIRDWWRAWCDVNHEKSFDIRELFYTNSPVWGKKYFQDIPPLPSLDFYVNNKNIRKLFSFYGGAYPKSDRQYLTIKMLEFADTAEIDFIGKFQPKENLLAYAENILYYKNQSEIDLISELYDRFITSEGALKFPSIFVKEKVQDERMTFSARQWEVDSCCWASVVRETANDDVYSCLSEKTLRAFLHHVAVIPAGFQSVHELEKLGFWFPHDIVDYSYQAEAFFSTRVSGIGNTLKNVSTKYSFGQLQEHYLDNVKNFHHNAELVYEYINNKESYQ